MFDYMSDKDYDVDHPYTIKGNDPQDRVNVNEEEAKALVELGIIDYCQGCSSFHPNAMRDEYFKFDFVRQCVEDVRKLRLFHCKEIQQ